MSLHVAIAGPVAGEDVRGYLHPSAPMVPRGYLGAPLTGILIGELLRLGHRVTAVTTDPTLPMTGGPVSSEGQQFTFIACPSRPRAWRPNGLRLGRALDLFAVERRMLRDALMVAAPDIVHAHWSYEFALAALAQRAPHLITCHDSPAAVLRLTRSPYRALRYLMARQVFRRGREFSTVSDYMATELASVLGHTPQVIPNPVTEHAFGLAKARPLSPSRRIAMVSNGWDQRKNPEPAIRAFARWRLIEPAAELHVFGSDFGEGETAQRWTHGQGLQAGITFHGRVSHRQLVTALAEVDVLLHPAVEESFGVVLAEAMALGLPVVAGRNSGAVPWVLGADAAGSSACALLIDVNSADAIAHALADVFDARYTGRSEAGLRRARDAFSPTCVAKAYETRYQIVLQHAAGGQRSGNAPAVERST